MKEAIKRQILAFAKPQADLRTQAAALFDALGYRSDKQLDPLKTPQAFLGYFDTKNKIRKEAALVPQWCYADLVFQISSEELTENKAAGLFNQKEWRASLYQSYLFITIGLADQENGRNYSKTQLSAITREVNRLFMMPAIVLFQHGHFLSLAVINRRLNKTDETKDVVEKVTIIKDIDCSKPHRAHIEILTELSLPYQRGQYNISSFADLHAGWKKTLDLKVLNDRFYTDIYHWYLWAREAIDFPKVTGEPKDHEQLRAEFTIRLLTRFMFCWFIKEKGLVPDALFDTDALGKLLKDLQPTSETDSTYYKAILQNLFFATLNSEMNTETGPKHRRWQGDVPAGQTNADYLDHQSYRYHKLFRNEADGLAAFATIPFLNGGLFECLDRRDENGKESRYDCYSSQAAKQPTVPNHLFFGGEAEIEVGDETKHKRGKVSGLINIFNAYKFTIAENTPLEEEVALDPELLGKIFENLLATYNPETSKSARKETGSFYTPREIVNYMVDESLKAYLCQKLTEEREENKPPLFDVADATDKLNQLFSIQPGDLHPFSKEAAEEEVKELVTAISKCNVLDPACGSGAFPMGILHRMVDLLAKLDPNNHSWKAALLAKAEADLERAIKMEDEVIRGQAIDSANTRKIYIKESFNRANHEFDYTRKLFLIENCIYGVDIQPIAVQISKLRFFISLILEQTPNDAADNRGMLSLPNLETKFVAANSLMPLKGNNKEFENPEVKRIEKQLEGLRQQLFYVRNWAAKKNLRKQEKETRQGLKLALIDSGFGDAAAQLASDWDPFDTLHAAPFFDREHMFGLDLVPGFDIVIGNPPYFQVLKGTYPEAEYPYSEGLDQGKQNLYKLFVEFGYNQLCYSGTNCLIVQSSLMCDLTSTYTRKLLLDKTKIIAVIEFPKKAQETVDQVFQSVLQGTCIILFQKNEHSNIVPISINNNLRTIHNLKFCPISKDTIAQAYPKTLYFPLYTLAERTIAEKLFRIPLHLANYIQTKSQGDINLTTQSSSFSTNKTSFPLVRGENVHKFIITYKTADYINTPLTQEIGKLNSKEIFIIFQEITGTTDHRRLHAASSILGVKAVYGHTTNKIKVEQELSFTLLGIVNTKLLDWYFRKTSTNNHVMGYELEQLPIVLPSDKKRLELEILVTQIISLKKENKPTQHLEDEIDQLVYQLYGLTEAEIEIVEASYRK